MKQVLVISDIHGDRFNYLNELVPFFKMVDVILFTGDGYNTLVRFMSFNKIDDTKLFAVRGNCDFCNLDETKILSIEKIKIMLTHGHNEHVNLTLDALKDKAQLNDIDLVIYGHTHIYHYDKSDKLHVLNSGSVDCQRDSFVPSCAFLTIKDTQIKCVKLQKQL